MRTSLALPAFLLTFFAHAQTEVRNATYAFAGGVYPTYSVVFADVDADDVEKYMKERLKPISLEMGGKKEIMSIGTRLPEVSADTLRVFVKTEQAGKGTDVTAHVAFRADNAFVGPESPETQREACRSWVYQQALMLKRTIVQEEVEASQKQLDRLQDDLAGLIKDKVHLENALEKSERKTAEDQLEHEQVTGESKLMAQRIGTKRQEMAGAPSEAMTKDFEALEKEQEKLTHKAAKLAEDIADGRKKNEDLQYQIKLNILNQDLKNKEITAQGKVVKDLVLKQAAID
jgi:hypothetical protein